MAMMVKRSVAIVVLLALCFPLLAISAPVYEVESDVETFNVLEDNLYSISPLSTSTATYWSSSDISNQLAYSKNISDRSTAIYGVLYGNGQNSIQQLLYNHAANFRSGGAFYTGVNNIWVNTNHMASALNSIEETMGDISIASTLGFPDGDTLYKSSKSGVTSASWYDVSDGFVSFSGYGNNRKQSYSNFYKMINMIAGGTVTSNPLAKYEILWSSGSSGVFTGSYGLADVTTFGFTGLAQILRGGSGSSIVNSIWDSQNTNADGSLVSTEWRANNILSAFSALFPIQHDLARLTNFLATGEKVKLEQANEKNVEAINENFTGDKGVQPDNINEMSGIGDSIGGLTDTGVSVGDGFVQIGNSWNFFSADTQSQLNTAPSTYARDDDFIYFYDPDNSALDELLEQVRGGE